MSNRVPDEELMARIRAKTAAVGDQDPATFADADVPSVDGMYIDEIPTNETFEEMMARARAARSAEQEQDIWGHLAGRDKAVFNRGG